MTKQQALDRLNLIRVWYEDYGTPDADYDAIVYAIGVIEEAPERLDTLVKALEAEHKKLLEMQKALKNVPDTNVGDTISRQAAIDALKNDMASLDHIIKGMSGYDVRLDAYVAQRNQVDCDIDTINNLSPAQPETGILTWLLAYHTKSFELRGRYLPNEVIGWLIADFRKQYMSEGNENKARLEVIGLEHNEETAAKKKYETYVGLTRIGDPDE